MKMADKKKPAALFKVQEDRKAKTEKELSKLQQKSLVKRTLEFYKRTGEF